MDNLKSLVETRFGKCTLSRSGNGTEYMVACPFCPDLSSGYRKKKLSINFGIRGYKCWRCGAHGNVYTLFEGDLKGRELPKAEAVGPVVLPRASDVIPAGTVYRTLPELPETHAAIKYLTTGRNRSFDIDTLHQRGVAFCEQGRVFGGTSDMWFNTTHTLVFPMVYENELRGWQSRLLFEPDALTDDQMALLDVGQSEDGDWNFIPKYLTAPGFPRGEIFYNWDIAIQTACLVVCEGTFDALAVGDSGIAALGKGLGAGQLRRLKESGKPIVLLLDPDAREAAHNYHMELSVTGLPVFNVCLEGNKDAGDMATEAIWDQINAHIASKVNKE